MGRMEWCVVRGALVAVCLGLVGCEQERSDGTGTPDELQTKTAALTVEESIKALRSSVYTLQKGVTALNAWKLEANGELASLGAAELEHDALLQAQAGAIAQLTARVEALESALDALEGAAGGPTVVDANGQVVGDLMKFNTGGDCANWPFPKPAKCDSYDVYNRQLGVQVSVNDVHGIDAPLFYQKADCTGIAFVGTGTYLAEDPITHQILGQSGAAVKVSTVAQLWRGTCTAQSSNGFMVVAAPTTLQPFALPLALPLSVQ
jgi:hypothetical protein